MVFKVFINKIIKSFRYTLCLVRGTPEVFNLVWSLQRYDCNKKIASLVKLSNSESKITSYGIPRKLADFHFLALSD
jgi:hypothetical protein